jgi:two-component system sensor histidine kinase CpxA
MEQMIQGTRDLTANVSHELRSPLARIRVAQELLRDRLERGETNGTLPHLTAIQEEVEILDRLIGRILALSRMDFQGGAFRPEEADLSGIVRDLMERFRPAMREKGLGVEGHVEDIPFLMGDKAALETAVSNLLDNALRYTPEGGTVRVELRAQGGEVRLGLWNSAEGLPGDEVERLFEPFYRGAKGGAGGSGLGLAISKRIAEQHGGAMGAQYADGGLWVHLTLPRETPGPSGPSAAR